MKYDSFYDKIKDYHIRKLQLTKTTMSKATAEKYHSEYNALTKAKKDIRDKVKESIEGALLFSKIFHWALLPDRKDSNNDTTYEEIAKDPKFANYAVALEKDKEIRLDFEKENKKFVRKIFSEYRMEKIFDLIFYNNYTEKTELDKEYRFRIAELMLVRAISELRNYTPPHLRFIQSDLDRAVEIATFLKFDHLKLHLKK
jgi:hypothetical protein